MERTPDVRVTGARLDDASIELHGDAPEPVPWRRGEFAEIFDAQGRAVILPLAESATGVPVVFDGTAVAIWSMVDASHTTEDIVTELSRAYAVDSDAIRGDVEAFLAELLQNRLVQR